MSDQYDEFAERGASRYAEGSAAEQAQRSFADPAAPGAPVADDEPVSEDEPSVEVPPVEVLAFEDEPRESILAGQRRRLIHFSDAAIQQRLTAVMSEF